MTYTVISALLLAILIAPFVGGVALISYLIVNRKRDRERKAKRIATLRTRVAALPLDEENLRKRLETFDRILAEVKNEKIKMEYLKQLAKGKRVEVKKEEEPYFDSEAFFREQQEQSRRDFYNYLHGIGYAKPASEM